MTDPRVRRAVGDPPEPDEGAEHPVIVGATRRRSWVELSVALTAVVVSVASLFVSRHQAQVMDRQLAASVWPMLEYLTSNNGRNGPELSLTIANSGIGPARIRAVQVLYQGKPVRDAGDLMRTCCGLARGAPMSTATSGLAGRLLQAGNAIDFLRVPVPPDTMPAARTVYVRLAQARLDVDVRVCYCSVLGDCWNVSSVHDDEDPAPASSCADARKLPQYH